jgi:putative hydrolase of the HAD superfamily
MITLRGVQGSCQLGLQGAWQEYLEIKAELIFEGICKQNSLVEYRRANPGGRDSLGLPVGFSKEAEGFSTKLRLLRALKDYPLGVVSNGQRVFSEIELKYLDLFTFQDRYLFIRPRF